MRDNDPTITKRLGDAKAACQILGCGPTHLWRLANEGQITPIRLGSRMTRYDLAELNALADRLIVEARAKAAAKRAARSSEPERLAA